MTAWAFAPDTLVSRCTSPGGVSLAVDGGQTAYRLALVSDGGIAARTTVPGFSFHQALAPDDAIGAAVESGWEELRSSQMILDTVCLGLTGSPALGRKRRELAAVVADRLGARRVAVTGDAVISHLGALAGSPGIVVVAGTGAITLGIDVGGRFVQVDGWGYMLGDSGGGYSVGRNALDLVLRIADGREFGSSVLTDLAIRRFGPLEAVARAVSERPDRVAEVASFSLEVAEAAHQGDSFAVAIWAEAVESLAHSVTVASQRLGGIGPVPISWAGRLFDVGDLLLEPFLSRITDRLPVASVKAPVGSPIDGAVALATSRQHMLPAELVTELST